MNNVSKAIVEFLYALLFVYLLTHGINFNFKRRTSYRYAKQEAPKSSRWNDAAKAFGISVKKLKKMSKEEIKKMYRDKAKKVHPDQGGNADDFRNLHEAYQFAYSA
jgi:hypothetical protein